MEMEWRPLQIHSSMANTVEHIDGNIRTNLGGGHSTFNALMGTKSGAVAVVGSGPSLKRNWHKLLKFKGDILACNASFQFLLDRGITATYMMCFDADPLMLEFITPVKGVTYLMASRCPPKAFELLDGCNVVMWHAAGDKHIEDILTELGRMEPMITGGGAAITRAMVLVHPMGYTDVHLFGADSSFHNGDTHIRKSTTEEKTMPLLCNMKVFDVAPWMAQQAEDFKILAPALINGHGVKLHVHGDGLIPHLAKTMGIKTDEPLHEYLWRTSNTKARWLWRQL